MLEPRHSGLVTHWPYPEVQGNLERRDWQHYGRVEESYLRTAPKCGSETLWET